MKIVGIILIGMGLALLFFTVAGLFIDTGKTVSPVPESQGVRVIYVSPAK
jgi:hypothetical protein